MIETINSAQTIFTIFYGLYFAVIVTLTGALQPFDTPQIFGCGISGGIRLITTVRLITSFVVLNILPLYYFVYVFGRLAKIQAFSFAFWPMLGLLFLSVVGFGFYRIFWGVMLIKIRGDYLFYGKELPKPLQEQLDERSLSHRDPMSHIIPGFIWVIIFGVIGFRLLGII